LEELKYGKVQSGDAWLNEFVPYLGGIEIEKKEEKERGWYGLYRTLEELKFFFVLWNIK